MDIDSSLNTSQSFCNMVTTREVSAPSCLDFSFEWRHGQQLFAKTLVSNSKDTCLRDRDDTVNSRVPHLRADKVISTLTCNPKPEKRLSDGNIGCLPQTNLELKHRCFFFSFCLGHGSGGRGWGWDRINFFYSD